MCVLFGLAVAGSWGQSKIPAEQSMTTVNSNNWLQVTGTSGNGDPDPLMIAFFEIPDSVTSTIYFAVRDPATDGRSQGAGGFDLSGPGSTPGVPDQDSTGTTTFSLVGGTGTLSNANSRLIYYATISQAYTPATGAGSGTLSSFSAANVNDAAFTSPSYGWTYFAGVSPSQGEHIGNKYYFKVVAQAGGTVGKNAFQLDVSYNNSGEPTGIIGVRAFAYAWTLALIQRTGATWNLYPFVDDGATGNVTLHNWDMDSGESLAFAAKSGYGLTAPTVSANGGSWSTDADTNTYTIATVETNSGQNQRNGTWHETITENTNPAGTDINTSMFWASNSANTSWDGEVTDVPKRVYAAAYTPPDPYRAAISASDGVAISNGTDLELVTLQIADVDGSPLPYARNLYVTIDGGGTIDSSSTSTAAGSINAASHLLATNTDGMGWVKVKRSSVGTSTIAAYWDGTGGSSSFGSASVATTSVSFIANPDPTISSASNFSAASGAGATAIPAITITNSPVTNNFTTANDLRIRIPSSLDCAFVTTITPTLTGTGSAHASMDALATIRYPDTGTEKTLFITVGSDFSAGQTLIVSGLQLQTFGTASTGKLELSWDGGTTYTALDDKNYTITSAAPFIVSRETADLNNNGYIDAVKLTFSETIKDSTITAGAAGFSIAGASSLAFSSTTNGDVANNNYIYVTFTDSVLGSDATPLVSYSAAVGSVTDNDGTPQVLPTQSAIAASDRVGPSILSARTVSTTSVEITLSESVDDASLAGADFVFSSFTTVGANAAASSISTGSTPNDAIVVATLAAAIGGDETANVSLAAANAIYDPSGSGSAQTGNVGVTDGIPAAPVIIQRETVDSSPYNGKIDRIRLVFSSTVDDSTAQTSGFTVSGYPTSSCISTASTTPGRGARWAISPSSETMRGWCKSRRWRHGD